MTDSQLVAFDDPSFDPLAVFEALSNQSTMDPYPVLHKLRAVAEVQTIEQVRLQVGDEAANQLVTFAHWPEGVPVYLLLSYDAIHSLDSELLSKEAVSATSMALGRTLIHMDGNEHRLHRALVQHAFTRRATEEWHHHIVEPEISQCIDEFVDKKCADLSTSLSLSFPINVMAALLGLPEEHVTVFRQWAVALICAMTASPAHALEASQKLGDYLLRLISERREHSGSDMLSMLANAEIDGERLSDEAIVSFFRMLLFAGAETTYRSSGILLLALLDNPEQLAAVERDRTLVSVAIEEALRWETILQRVPRVAIQDMEVRGVKIPAGSVVCSMLGSANRDEGRYEAPDAFNIFREPKPHLTFGFGPHMCLGLHLARMETRAFLNAVLDRLPGIRLDLDYDHPQIRGGLLRGVNALRVRWT